MEYKEKYLKYKKKYLQLKNQIGGYILKLEEWTKIENSGQHNCGIFISDIYPKYILKCESSNELGTIHEVININNKIQLFPKIIDFTTIENSTYCTMQKLDGDITNIYFNLFPKIALKNIIDNELINEKQKETLFDLFLGKCNYTMQNSKDLSIFLNKIIFDCLIDPEIYDLYIQYLESNPQVINKNSNFTIKGNEYNNIYNFNIDMTIESFNDSKNILDKIKKFSDISLELYDKFMNELIKLWESYHEIIIKEIIKIKLVLLKLGYCYEDNKYDNFGYILSNIPIDDFRRFKAPRIFGKYLYVYFLDWESGFSKISNGNEEYTLKKIINDVNESFKYYSANGQYYISPINDSKIRNNSGKSLDLLGINPEILKILQKTYLFDFSKFEHTFTTIEEVEKFIYN